jgi:hypothetical protein
MNKIKILNTWVSTKGKLVYYYFDDAIYRNGDYAIYRHWDNSFIHTYKSVSISQLVKANTDLVDALVANHPPQGVYDCKHFLYNRALANKEKGLQLLKL